MSSLKSCYMVCCVMQYPDCIKLGKIVITQNIGEEISGKFSLLEICAVVCTYLRREWLQYIMSCQVT